MAQRASNRPANLDWSGAFVTPKTRCKHGFYECRTCGTSQVTDALHTTRGGRGVVGQAIARTKSRGK